MAFRKYSTLIIVALTVAITYMHYSIAIEDYAMHDIYRQFYYIPVLLSALVFGLKGAVMTYLLILFLYLPYILITWTGIYIVEIYKLLHLLLLGIIAIFAGVLIERDKKQRGQIERERHLASMGRIAATISHDLKNPLITIIGFAKRISEGKNKTESAADLIMVSALKMQKIVNDVLDFSKPVQLDRKAEDVRDVVNSACNASRAKAESEGIRLSVKLHNSSLEAEIDGFYLERALVNIINNAIEASEKGQDIDIESAREKDRILIRIKDRGKGMDRETLENIFIPFYTKKATGTGLGMSISKNIIEGHGGKIYIHSKQGLGTEVKIELPSVQKKS
jgi:signal transduction histidine kinase